METEPRTGDESPPVNGALPTPLNGATGQERREDATGAAVGPPPNGLEAAADGSGGEDAGLTAEDVATQAQVSQGSATAPDDVKAEEQSAADDAGERSVAAESATVEPTANGAIATADSAGTEAEAGTETGAAVAAAEASSGSAASPSSSTPTTLAGTALHPMQKKFTSLNVNKKFLEKASPTLPAAAALPSKQAVSSPQPPSRLSAISSASRLTSAKLSSGAKAQPAGWGVLSSASQGAAEPGGSPLPAQAASGSVSSPAVPAGVAATKNAPGAAPSPKLVTALAGSSANRSTSPRGAEGSRGSPSLRNAALTSTNRSTSPATGSSSGPSLAPWAKIKLDAAGATSAAPSRPGQRSSLVSDFPTAAEAARQKQEAERREKAQAAEAAAKAEAALQQLERFRGTSLGAGNHWDEMDDDALDDVVQFGDGTQYKVPLRSEREEEESRARGDDEEEEEEPTGPVSKEERFKDVSHDRSWPPRAPAPHSGPSEVAARPQLQARTSSHGNAAEAGAHARSLFNARSNKLETMAIRSGEGVSLDPLSPVERGSSFHSMHRDREMRPPHRREHQEVPTSASTAPVRAWGPLAQRQASLNPDAPKPVASAAAAAAATVSPPASTAASSIQSPPQQPAKAVSIATAAPAQASAVKSPTFAPFAARKGSVTERPSPFVPPKVEQPSAPEDRGAYDFPPARAPRIPRAEPNVPRPSPYGAAAQAPRSDAQIKSPTAAAAAAAGAPAPTANQREEMLSAAERARKRRMEEEEERAKEKERARAKAAAIEEKMRKAKEEEEAKKRQAAAEAAVRDEERRQRQRQEEERRAERQKRQREQAESATGRGGSGPKAGNETEQWRGRSSRDGPLDAAAVPKRLSRAGPGPSESPLNDLASRTNASRPSPKAQEAAPALLSPGDEAVSWRRSLPNQNLSAAPGSIPRSPSAVDPSQRPGQVTDQTGRADPTPKTLLQRPDRASTHQSPNQQRSPFAASGPMEGLDAVITRIKENTAPPTGPKADLGPNVPTGPRATASVRPPPQQQAVGARGPGRGARVEIVAPTDAGHQAAQAREREARLQQGSITTPVSVLKPASSRPALPPQKPEPEVTRTEVPMDPPPVWNRFKVGVKPSLPSKRLNKGQLKAQAQRVAAYKTDATAHNVYPLTWEPPIPTLSTRTLSRDDQFFPKKYRRGIVIANVSVPTETLVSVSPSKRGRNVAPERQEPVPPAVPAIETASSDAAKLDKSPVVVKMPKSSSNRRQQQSPQDSRPSDQAHWRANAAPLVPKQQPDSATTMAIPAISPPTAPASMRGQTISETGSSTMVNLPQTHSASLLAETTKGRRDSNSGVAFHPSVVARDSSTPSPVSFMVNSELETPGKKRADGFSLPARVSPSSAQSKTPALPSPGNVSAASTWGQGSLTFPVMEPSPSNAPDRDHIKNVWSLTNGQSTDGGRPTQNSLKGIADDFPSTMSLDIQDLRAEEGTSHPSSAVSDVGATRSNNGFPSMGLVQPRHNGFASMHSSPILGSPLSNAQGLDRSEEPHRQKQAKAQSLPSSRHESATHSPSTPNIHPSLGLDESQHQPSKHQAQQTTQYQPQPQHQHQHQHQHQQHQQHQQQQQQQHHHQSQHQQHPQQHHYPRRGSNAAGGVFAQQERGGARAAFSPYAYPNTLQNSYGGQGSFGSAMNPGYGGRGQSVQYGSYGNRVAMQHQQQQQQTQQAAMMGAGAFSGYRPPMAVSASSGWPLDSPQASAYATTSPTVSPAGSGGYANAGYPFHHQQQYHRPARSPMNQYAGGSGAFSSYRPSHNRGTSSSFQHHGAGGAGANAGADSGPTTSSAGTGTGAGSGAGTGAGSQSATGLHAQAKPFHYDPYRPYDPSSSTVW
ncbi:hypothetical protein FA10DRAFT_276800 [Acaromyces ingoldii]|uniref:Uncharacterized protein n=1 Tax=Acaromyces ingoldii TaxID=215250 RepID=A0A316YVK5_9BASI|nr:hypothetical protein FA10DRAFT_276800 [Acaromyces ingoldii]PWN92794.1 hypothetical protein FA10DRAFT_276800 [Acaromyces ingoldii]